MPMNGYAHAAVCAACDPNADMPKFLSGITKEIL